MNRLKLCTRMLATASDTKVIPRRSIYSSRILQSDDEPYTDEGSYGLPFQTENRYRFFAVAFVFLASGFWYPYWIYQHHRVKQLEMNGFLPKKE